ncbi:ATP-binding protein [Bordetella bronchialis]|uniref:histidine kinase n=1 Tax=Bordetella bronchialis TaxID=463025 RepID=A0A193FE14_9BORD|nr:ATP-binding protein [Bordetella bronchialis]ANN65810.1 ATPase [Bordetella bronchialis]ANN70841.1 ATPase [Bordetella bronchialis]
MKFSPRSLLPHSLRTRLILLVLGCMLVAQAGTLAVGSHYRHRFVDDVVMDYIVTTIRTLRAAVSEVPAEDRAGFVRDASGGQWHLWARTLPAEAQLARFHGGGLPPPPPRDGPSTGERDARLAEMREYRRTRPDGPDDIRRDLRGLVRQLNERLNDGTRVALSRGPRPEVFISLAPNPTSEDTPQLREWLVIPLDRLDPPLATPMIITWLAVFGVVLILAGGFSWHITRPITRLAEAADKLAAGQPQRVEPSGPHETRVLGERFNAMLDALQESESVRRTLLAGLPHDLKAPLSRMWLRIEMSDDAALTEGLRKDLRDMQYMVDQFIGFVRGTDPAGYRYAPVPLGEWLAERVQGWQGAGSPVTLRIDSDQPMTVQGDAVALARLLDNLVANALHHGAPPIEVSLAEQDGKAVLSVSDHGAGIPADRRAEALRPFARLDDARTRTGNVGLGLALADAIARAHGGSLTLGTAPGGGLCVEITLPLQA